MRRADLSAAMALAPRKHTLLGPLPRKMSVQKLARQAERSRSPTGDARLDQGLGLVQLPRGYLANGIAAGRLVTVLDDWAPPQIEGFYMYYPSRSRMQAPLKALVDFLRHRSSRQSARKRANE
jgi:DNA-binding transcriptional LysR family regulator